MSRHFLRSVLFLLFLLPFGAHAALIEFDHIEYDPSGSDTNREWIRIHNSSGAPLDLTNWRLVEGGTNHKIKAVDAVIIPTGGYAIIAADAAQYFAEHLDSPDVLFDSSFSLSNNGETLALKDGMLTTVATFAYTATPKVKPETQVASVAGAPRTARTTRGAPTPTTPLVKDSATPLSAAVLGSAGSLEIGGLLPWFVGLLGLVLVAGGALMFMKNGGGSGYTLVDISDKSI